MKNTIIDNYITSIIGGVVIIAAFATFYKGSIDAVSFTTLLALGLTYLRAKDSLIPGLTAKEDSINKP